MVPLTCLTYHTYLLHPSVASLVGVPQWPCGYPYELPPAVGCRGNVLGHQLPHPPLAEVPPEGGRKIYTFFL